MPATPTQGERFQVIGGTATHECVEATRATECVVATYRNELILANYVAGAFWTDKGVPGTDVKNTKRLVTHHEGMTGTYVKPTPMIRTPRWQNRGCMGQNGADWLARHAYDATRILRYFYGADLVLTDLRSARLLSTPAPRSPMTGPPRNAAAESSANDDGAAFLMIAGAGLTWMLRGTR
jgi:hypothetical protein